MEKQFEKNVMQRDFGVKGWGSVDEKPFILAPEIIASLPGGDGDAIGLGDGGSVLIEKDLGCREEQWIGGVGETVNPYEGD